MGDAINWTEIILAAIGMIGMVAVIYFIVREL